MKRILWIPLACAAFLAVLAAQNIDLGTISDTLPTVGKPAVGVLGVQAASWSRTETFDEFRLGLSYLFH